MRALVTLFLTLALCTPAIATSDGSDTATGPATVRLETNHGDVVLELDRDAAPVTVENFLRYADEGAYAGTVFHRVIPGFMIQGGGFTADLERKPTHEPIRNEADNGRKNRRGTIAMARTRNPHSATSQFFINLADNAQLDHRSKTPRGWGYCVFGEVVEGMETVDAIAEIPTRQVGRHANVPERQVVIESVVVESE